MAITTVQNYLTSNNAFSNVFSLELVQNIFIQALVTGVYGNYPQWLDYVSYNPGDAVSYNGFDYVCLVANLNMQPDVNPTEWGLATAGLEFIFQGTSVESGAGVPDNNTWVPFTSLGPFGPGTWINSLFPMTYNIHKYGRIWFKQTTLPNGLVNAAVTLGE